MSQKGQLMRASDFLVHNGGAKRRHEPAGSAASCAGEMPTASAICWRRANQRARQLFLYDAIATGNN